MSNETTTKPTAQAGTIPGVNAPPGPAATPPATQAKAATAKADPQWDKEVEYTPFMGSEKMILTPRMVYNFLARPTKQGKMPVLADIVRFLKLCEARALNPWEGDAFLVGYDTNDGPEFNLITAHQAFVKRAEVHPEYDGMESGVTIKYEDGTLEDIPGDYVPDGTTLVAGWARVHFKDRKIPSYQRIALSTYNTGRSRWNKDAAGMISKVAEAHALRIAFPTKLGGMYLSDEFSVDSPLPEVNLLPSPAGKTKSDQLAEAMRTRGSQPEITPPPGNGNGNGHELEAEPAGAAAGAAAPTREPGEDG